MRRSTASACSRSRSRSTTPCAAAPLELRSALRSVERTNEALKKAKAQADQANAFKSTFLAFVSHDLLQPLNAAKLSLSTLTELETQSEQRGLRAAGRPMRWSAWKT